MAVLYAEVEVLVRSAGPALLRLPTTEKPGWLVLLGSQRRRVTLLGPDLRVRRVAVEMVRTAVCQAIEAPLLAEVDQVLAGVGIAGRRHARARRTMLRERLSAERLGRCWLLRLPAGASFGRQLRQAHVVPHLLVLLGAYATQYLCWLLAWWLVGQGAL